ncbi:MAG: replication-associated recombination protein A [Longimicrobiales bacterium]
MGLFGDDAPERDETPDAPVQPNAPLAARMRPRTLEEFVGQPLLLAPGRALRELIEKDEIGSIILWGPPGSGKTTLARIIAERTRATFVQFSAVTEGVARVREIIEQARTRLRATGRRTILFCDEIHRFNKAQQDAFLPHVEAGTISLIGATTENPSFEVIGALLSRSRVFVLEPLAREDLARILRNAHEDEARGIAALRVELPDESVDVLSREADGDARRALNALEAAAALAGPGGTITPILAREALQLRFVHYDKGGEEHYNLLSAFHKALRGSHPDGALYWAARLIEGGGDPMILFRRAIAMASEDIGLADPNALPLAVAARDAFHMLGPPEGFLALAEMTIYLATAPKSNRAYVALSRALEAARESPAEPVPLHIRNAPTRLMKQLRYGEGYRYAHDFDDAFVPQEYLPEALRGTRFYEPGSLGFETRIAERMRFWEQRRRGEEPAETSPDGPGGGDVERDSQERP